MWGKRVSGWLALSIAASALLVIGILLVSGIVLSNSKGSAPGKASAAQACVSKFSVSPTSGVAGSRFTVQGSSWPAGKSIGVYLVDPTHHLHPTTLQLLTAPQNGAWSANITVPQVVSFHAVGDETTGNGSPQTIRQTVAPGQYLIYAAAGDSTSFSAASVCPIKFTIAASSAAALTHTSQPTSGGAQLSAPLTTTGAGQASTASTAPLTQNSAWSSTSSAALFVMLLLLACAVALLRRTWLQSHLRRYQRQLFALGSATLALFMLLALTPSGANASAVVHAAAAAPTATTLYSDDFEADAIGSFPAGWNIEAGSTWSVQMDGTHALEQTSTSTTPLYGVYAGSSAWTDYSLSADVKPGAGSTTANTSVVAIEGRYQDANNFYSLLVKNGNAWYLGKKINGVWTTLATGSTSYNTTSWYSWTLTMTGTTISASINGVTLATTTDSSFTAGDIGLKTRNQSGFDNIVVTATGASAPTPTPTAAATATATPAPAPTATATPAPAPTATATPAPAPTATATPLPAPTATATPAPTATATVAPSTTPSSLFSDNFEADTVGSFPAGWNVEAGTSWSVQPINTQVLQQTSTSNSTLYGVYAGSSTWTDYTVAADVQPGAGSTTANTSIVAIEGRYQDANNFYSLLVKNGNAWYLGKKINGVWTTLATGSFTYNTTSWYNWTLTMTGSTISASINGTTLATSTDTTFTAGAIGLKTRNVSSFDNVVVTAAGATATAPTPTATAVATATATPATAATATATPSVSGSITGQITDAATGAPIVGAQVSTVPASVTATTNSTGNYTLANVSVTTYDVVASASGYNLNHASNVSVTSGTTVTANIAQQAIPAYTAMDTFTQPDQLGWNSSTDGHTWTDDAAVYPGASVSIQGNYGYADTYTAATDRDEWMSPYYADQLVAADFNVSQYGQDSYQHGARLLGRIQDGNNFIDFAINYATSTLQIWSNKNNNWVMLSQVSVPAFQTGQWYHAKLLTVGTMSYGKVWAYNTAEPGWQISGSQTVLTTGSGGIRSTYCDINWSNFSVQAVTTITGVVKNTSGTAISGATVSDGQTSATTDASGRYVLIEPNTNATYTVTASATGYTTQSSTATTTSLASTTLNFTL